MAQRWQSQKTGFLWQAALILLPVLLLAVLCAFAIQQDRATVEQQAREQARRYAQYLAEQIWTTLTSTENLSVRVNDRGQVRNEESLVPFVIDRYGRLVSPSSYATALVPAPLDLDALNAAQAKLWGEARKAEFVAGDSHEAADVYRRFLATKPPERFMQLAQLNLAQLELSFGGVESSAARLHALLEGHYLVPTESGLPLEPLLWVKLMETAIRSSNQVAFAQAIEIANVCSNAVEHPTLLTQRVLDTAGELARVWGKSSGRVQHWQETWEKHEQARRLYRAARPLWLRGESEAAFRSRIGDENRRDEARLQEPLPMGKEGIAVTNFPRFELSVLPRQTNPSGIQLPRAFWLHEGGDWLCVSFGTPTSWVWCRRESLMRRRVAAILQQQGGFAEWYGIGVELADRAVVTDTNAVSFPVTGGKGAGPSRDLTSPVVLPVPVLATGLAGAKDGVGPPAVKVTVHFTQPSLLFARQRQRQFVFTLLIATAAGTALIGLFAAHRAFRRQLLLNELKSNFVSSVSHELRAPIASVRLMAEGLERGKIQDAQKQRQYFRFITQECRRLTALIENVLDFSRIEQGRKQYEFEPTDIRRLVEETVRGMEPGAAERQVSLQVSLPKPQISTFNPQPLLDGRALQQALVNLIDNAIKFSPPASTVTVGLEFAPLAPLDSSLPDPKMKAEGHSPKPVAAAELTRLTSTPSQSLLTSAATVGKEGRDVSPRASRITLWIEDHGPGIPPEEHERIFERFYRRGSELRRETQGVGIGLSIVKHIIEAHGGRVHVRSAVPLPHG